MYILPADVYDEFLSCPALVRICKTGNSLDCPALAIKTSSLSLKYFIQTNLLKASISQIENRRELILAVTIGDDISNLGTIWSVISSQNEIEAISAALKSGKMEIQLFNEGVVNVSSSTCVFEFGDSNHIEKLLAISVVPHQSELIALHKISKDQIRSNFENSILEQNQFQLKSKPNWTHNTNEYITLQGKVSSLNLLEPNEGDQQENLTHWLTDTLCIEGSHKSPQIYKGKKKRELIDLIFGYEEGTFIIESKTLSLFGRDGLPDRLKLKKNILNHIDKAVSQLEGASKKIKSNTKIYTIDDIELELNRDQPLHSIILIPDLSLLSEKDNLGGRLLKEFMAATNDYLHIMDPSSLLRSVQQALMISKNSESGMPPIKCFDFALLKYWEFASEQDTPDIDCFIRIK